jgi:hypothetical protein
MKMRCKSLMQSLLRPGSATYMEHVLPLPNDVYALFLWGSQDQPFSRKPVSRLGEKFLKQCANRFRF